jgi:hypothetical protein
MAGDAEFFDKKEEVVEKEKPERNIVRKFSHAAVSKR